MLPFPMVRRIPPLLWSRAVPFSSFLPRYLLRVSATPWQSSLSPLCFHTLTNPFSRNPFFFTCMQNPRGWCRGQNLRRPQPFSVHSVLPWQIHSFQAFAASFAAFCALSSTLALSFHQLAASFPETPGWGWVDPPGRLMESSTSSLSSVTGSLGGVRWAKRRGTVTARTFVAAAAIC